MTQSSLRNQRTKTRLPLQNRVQGAMATHAYENAKPDVPELTPKPISAHLHDLEHPLETGVTNLPAHQEHDKM